jgi:hypothetical protein
MTRRIIDPDIARPDDGAYWAAALVVAIQAGDAGRQALARDHLRRLGYRVDVATAFPSRDGVAKAGGAAQ